MRIRADHEQRACILCCPCHHVVEIEAIDRSVDLESDVLCPRRLDDALDVDLQRLAASDQPAGRMRENVDIRIVGSGDEPAGDLIPGLAER